MEFRTEQGQHRYDGLVAVARDVVVGLDFDGTLSPIVEDPEHAVIHPEAPAVLVDLAAQVRAVVVITGRPARQVVELGGLDAVADALAPGAAAGGARPVRQRAVGLRRPAAFTSPEPPRGLQAFRDELPAAAGRRSDAAGALSRRRASRSRCTPAGCRTPRRPSSGWGGAGATPPSGTA